MKKMTKDLSRPKTITMYDSTREALNDLEEHYKMSASRLIGILIDERYKKVFDSKKDEDNV
jgi:hypothetical protein